MNIANLPKRILMFSRLNVWSMDDNKGAPSFYKTIKGYIDSGWELTLITPKGKNNNPVPNLNLINFNLLLSVFLKFPILRFFVNYLNVKYAEYKFYNIGRKLLNSNSENVILYAYEVHGVKASKKLSVKFNVPLVTRFQGTVLSGIKNNIFNRLLYYPHFSSLKTESDLVIMTNDGTLGDRVLYDLNNKSSKVLFLRNGIDINFFEKVENNQLVNLKEKYNLKQTDKILLTVSRLAKWKKVERAIHALNEVIKKDSNYKLIIVGDGDEKANLIKLTENLQLKDYIIFAGAQPHSLIKAYLKIANVFLSLYDLSNVGNPLLEAMILAKPIITLNVGSTNSIISHEINGILLDINDLSKIPYYIDKICNSNEFAISLGENARKYAKDNFWTWNERIKKEIENVELLLK